MDWMDVGQSGPTSYGPGEPYAVNELPSIGEADEEGGALCHGCISLDHDG